MKSSCKPGETFMKALVYTAERELTYRDEPAPQAAPGEALVAIESAGICGSDMHAYLGHDPRRVPPLILGHEAAAAWWKAAANSPGARSRSTR